LNDSVDERPSLAPLRKDRMVSFLCNDFTRRHPGLTDAAQEINDDCLNKERFYSLSEANFVIERQRWNTTPGEFIDYGIRIYSQFIHEPHSSVTRL
jgi:hypothetical protein